MGIVVLLLELEAGEADDDKPRDCGLEDGMALDETEDD